MTSAINPGVPADAVQVQKSLLRANFLAAKTEIEALQAAGIGPASETAVGTARIATSAEAASTTLDNLIITPKKLQQQLTPYATATNAVLKSGAQTMAGPLTINGITTPQLKIETTGAPPDPVELQLKTSGSTWRLINDVDGSFKINWGASAVRMTIDNTGKVGVGGASTGSNLDVNGSGDVSTRVRSTGASWALSYLQNSVRQWSLAVQPDGICALFDNTAGSARMAINASGQVGIGITPVVPLHVYNAGAGSIRIQSGVTTDTVLYLKQPTREWALINGTDNNFYVYDVTGAVIRMSVLTNGFVGIGIAPTTNLHVYSTTFGVIRVETGTNYWTRLSIKNTVKEWTVNSDSTGTFIVQDETLGKPRIVIGSDGVLHLKTGSTIVYDLPA